jgi:general secretion pathway protein M
MQALQAQVSALKGQNRLRPEEATRLLQASLGTLGPGASLVVNGDMATVQIKGASAAAVSQWLAQARVQAQALPVQARLGRSAASAAAGPTGAQGAAPTAPAAPALTPGPNPGNGPVQWEGQIVLQLPAPAKP